MLLLHNFNAESGKKKKSKTEKLFGLSISRMMRIPGLKLVLIFFITILETSYLKLITAKILVWILTSFLFIGLLFKIMHWSHGDTLLLLPALLIFSILFIQNLVEGDKRIIHYLLFIFLLQRVIMIVLIPISTFHWWIDLLLCTAITGIGSYNLFVKKDSDNITQN